VTIGETWETVAIEDSTTGRSIEAVAITGSSLVGVGRGECVPDFSDPTACYGAAWTDVSGAGWAAAPNQPGLQMGVSVPTSGPERGIYDIAKGPAGLVAVGYDYNPPRSTCAVAPCATGPAVWRSADGQTWERVDLDLGPGIVDRFSDPIVAITADDRRYVMVGYAQTLAAEGELGPAHAAAWTSSDGIDWTRATDSDDLDVGLCIDTGEEPDCGGMLDVVSTPTGFVAVGHTRNGIPGQDRPAAWTSPDGLTWTSALYGLDFDGRLSAVAAGGPGIVAVGTLCQPDCVGSNAGGIATTSSDGTEWTPVPVTGAPALEAIASTRRQQFAIGRADQSQGPTDLELWRGNDGVGWRRESGLPVMTDADGYIGSDIAASSDRVVVVVSAHVGGFASIRSVAYSSAAAAAPTEAAPSPSAAAPA
jgi:hypothetical protein